MAKVTDEKIDEKRKKEMLEDFKQFRKSGISPGAEALAKAIQNEKFIEMEQSYSIYNTRSYSCNNAKIIVDENGYILNADGLLGTMWGEFNLDEGIIGKHIIQLAKMMKEYSANKDIYKSFLENVILDFYENKEHLEKNNILSKQTISEEYREKIFNLLDKYVSEFFPQDGEWYSNCFKQPQEIKKINLPCHLDDFEWLADFLIQTYKIKYIDRGIVLDYVKNSQKFNNARNKYKKEIVKWQINWMSSGGDNWICDDELFMFSKDCDVIFRKGIVDTLLAIGLDIDTIEEGIEMNYKLWREGHMRVAFHNAYSIINFSLDGNVRNNLEEPSQEHFEKWLKLRLYEYYIKHKESVDKYGEILPAMQMTDQEVRKLKIWLNAEHEKRIKQIEDYKNADKLESSPIKPDIDFYGCDFPDLVVVEKENLKYKETVKGKSKSLVRKLFGNKK